MRRDTAAPYFGVVPFRELRFVGAQRYPEYYNLEVCALMGPFMYLALCWLLAGSWRFVAG